MPEMMSQRKTRSHRSVTPTFPLLALAALTGCGSPVVDSTIQPLPPASVSAKPIPTTPMQSEFGNLPRVPASSILPRTSVRPNGQYYEVRAGDTLTSISQRHSTSVERLLDSNGLERDTVLQPGQLVYIPDAR